MSWSLIQAPTVSWQGFHHNFAAPLMLLLSWHVNGGRLLLVRLSNELGVRFKPCFAPLAPGIRNKNTWTASLSVLKQTLGRCQLGPKRVKCTLTFSFEKKGSWGSYLHIPSCRFLVGTGHRVKCSVVVFMLHWPLHYTSLSHCAAPAGNSPFHYSSYQKHKTAYSYKCFHLNSKISLQAESIPIRFVLSFAFCGTGRSICSHCSVFLPVTLWQQYIAHWWYCI